MRKVRRILAFIALLSGAYQFDSCNSTKSPSFVGTWAFVDNTGNYWEEIYTDSIVWNFSEEAGLMVLRYQVVGNRLDKFDIDDTPYYSCEIISWNSKQILINCGGDTVKCERITKEYSIANIVRSDGEERHKYISDYYERKREFEKSTIGK